MLHAKSCRSIVDVGSNLGLVSILLSKAAPDAKIFAFEPDPTNFAMAQVNYELNGCKNIVGINAAVAANTGVIALHRSIENWGDHRTYALPASEPKTAFSADAQIALSVSPEILLETSLTNNSAKPIDLLKVDTQGSDIKILLAFHRLLAPNAIISLEFSPHHLIACGTTEEELCTALKPAKTLEMYAPPDEAHPNWHIKPTDIEELIWYFRTGTLGYRAVGYRDLLLRW
jgi:FkbM family methyltransferase